MLKIHKIPISSFLIYIFCIGKAFSFSADVVDISDRQYFQVVREVIEQAEKSIYMVMYLVNVDERNPKSRVFQLSQSLINAQDRGVAVTIILDQSVDYSRTKRGELWQMEGKNANAFRFFKEHGLDVSYDETSTLTHNKVLIIDKEIVSSKH